MSIKRLKEGIFKEIQNESRLYRYMEARKGIIAPGSLYVKTGSI